MTRRHAPLLTIALLLGCTAPPMPPPSDATADAARDPGPGPTTFTLEVLDDDLEVTRGESITLDVRVVRSGGYDEPVLVELAGLPDPLHTLARESRPGDDVTHVAIVTDVDGEEIPRAPFVVQATSLEGLRHTAPVHITVR